jgi:hypothetical protein
MNWGCTRIGYWGLYLDLSRTSGRKLGRLHNEELHKSYAFSIIKRSRTRLMGNVAFMGKVKVKLSVCLNWAPLHAGVLGSGGRASRILGLGTTWKWVVSFTPRSLYPQEKCPWFQLDRRLSGPQSRSGRGGEKKNSQPLLGLEPPIIHPIAQRYTTELSHLTVCMGEMRNVHSTSIGIPERKRPLTRPRCRW